MKVKQLTNKKPTMIGWGKKGKIPNSVWQNYDWEIKAKCYPECE